MRFIGREKISGRKFRRDDRATEFRAGAKFREFAINKTGRGRCSFGIWIEWECGTAESAYLMIFRFPPPSFTKQFPIALSKSSGQKWPLIYRSRIYRPPSKKRSNKERLERDKRWVESKWREKWETSVRETCTCTWLTSVVALVRLKDV